MKKVLFLLLLLILVTCSRSNGTGSTVPETDPVVEDTTSNNTPIINETDIITLRMIAYDWELGSYRDLIETFEAENPGIEIKMVSLEETLGLESGGIGQWPDGAAERLVSAADVMTTNAVSIHNSSSGFLLDLRPLMEADPTFDRNDFYPNALDYFESDGSIWGLPSTLNYTLIFYNKDAFDAIGHDYPQAGWSWDDFLSAAQATTIREGDDVTQWGLVQTSTSPYEFVLPRTGPIIDTSIDPPTPRFDRPEVLEMMQWYADLFLAHQVVPNLETPKPDEDGIFVPPGYELIEDGAAAMWPEWSGSWQWRNNQINMGVAPFPVDTPNDRTSQVFANGYVLSAGTRHPEAAWRWIDFLSQQPSMDEFSQDTAVPARRSVAEASGFWDRVDSELEKTLRYTLDHAYIIKYEPGYGAFYEAASAILLEGQSVAAALAEAQLQAETEIAEFVAEQEGVEDVEIIVSAPEEATAAEGAVTIVFLAGGGPNGLLPYRELAKTFQEQHPNIVVELETPNYSSGSISLNNIAPHADCFQWYGSVNSESDRAAVLSLEPFLDADPELSRQDFFAAAVDQFDYQGQLLGIPGEFFMVTIAYNKSLFDDAGVPYPTFDWTTDDFLETAVVLTVGDDPESKQYGFLPQEFETNDLSVFLERMGARFFDDSEDPPRLTYTHPDTVEAMRWFTSLTTEFGVKPIFTTRIGGVSNNQERNLLIKNGRAAMWSDNGFDFLNVNPDNLDIGIVPLPAGGDGTVTGGILSTTGYFISSGTSARQPCWEWITYLSAQPNLRSDGHAVPALRIVAESDAYQQAVGAGQAAANLASIQSLTQRSDLQRMGSEANWLAIGSYWWLSYAYDQIITAGVSVEAALADVQAKADAYRDCVIDRDALADEATQRECLGEVDEKVPSFFIETEE